MILPHDFVPGLIRSPAGTHCNDCGHVESDSIHCIDVDSLTPAFYFGTVEVIPDDTVGGAPT